jgi:zinc protease
MRRFNSMLRPCLGLGLLGLISGCAGLRGGPPPAWEQPPPAVRMAAVVQPGALSRIDLENGLEVMVLEDHRLPTVSLSVTLRRGAGAIPLASAGLADFMTELMNRGAGDRDALALARAVDDIGASLNVSAGWDSMSVSVSGLSRDLDQLVEILADVTLAPRFDPEEAEKTRKEQLASLSAAKDDPGTLARWRAMKTLYPDHRYGLPRIGTPERVERFDAGAAKKLHAAYFVANNAILSVSGDVDPEGFLARARQVFGAWKPGIVPLVTKPTPSPTPARRRIVIADKPDLVQTRIYIVHEGIARTDERRVAANVLNDVLGGSGFSSRMMKVLRSDAGLAYGVGSGFGLRRQPGPFVVSTSTRVTETRRAVDILLAEMEAIRSTRPVDAEALAKSKSYNVGQFGLGLETSSAVMQSLVNLSIFDLPDDALDTYRARVQAVTAAEVAGLATALLHPDRAAIVLLGPAEALAPQFEGMGEIEIVAP